jgi:hypothetical protein
MSHELSVSEGDGPYQNVSGHTGLPLPLLYPFEREQYPSLDLAILAARVRSLLYEQEPFQHENYSLFPPEPTPFQDYSLYPQPDMGRNPYGLQLLM